MRRILFAALIVGHASCVNALEVQPAPPVFVDLETAAVATLPVNETDSVLQVSVEIETLSSPTNEFEVAFFTSDTPKPETCRLLVGLDRGWFFARGLRLDSEVSDTTVLAEGPVRLSFSFFQHASGRADHYAAWVNGVANDFLTDQLVRLMPRAQSVDWRSIKVISRGLTDDLPTVRFDEQSKGLVIRICKR